MLRHRVPGYRAGDLDRLYPTLAVEEDVFVNYGFVARPLHALMHPRVVRTAWSATRRQRARDVLEFVRERGEAHPREVDDRFAHGAVRNAWGGLSSATTHLLDALHYRGLLRVARRDNGIRIYAARQQTPPLGARERTATLDALVDAAVCTYAPLPAPSLGTLVRRLRYAAPQLRAGLEGALARAKRRLAHASVDGGDWYWPSGEDPRAARDAIDGEVRLLAPFDPLVWDRVRFERFFGWAYRFEAYTPPRKRKLGYYAMPLLWGDKVVGWGNLSVHNDALASDVGYVAGTAPRSRRFARELTDEIERMRSFLRP